MALMPSDQTGRWRRGFDGRSHYSHDIFAQVSYCGIPFERSEECKDGLCGACNRLIMEQARFDQDLLDSERAAKGKS